jgi:arylsulfate sulfotransferase
MHCHSPRAGRALSFWALATLVTAWPIHNASATITNLKITASVPSPQPLGTLVVFQASAQGALDFQYSVQGPLDNAFHVVRDFISYGSLNWAPIAHEGVYKIQVIARNVNTGDHAQLVIAYTLLSRVTGDQPVINLTANPLVLLYSAPACPPGSSMLVRFALANEPWTATSPQSCADGLSMNFYIAGLQQNSVYYLQYEIIAGSSTQGGPVLTFPSGQSAIAPPASKVLGEPVPPSSVQQPVLLQSFISTRANPLRPTRPIATDLYGNILWYSPNNYVQGALLRPLPGGTMFMIASDNSIAIEDHLLFVQDLAGNPVQETNASIVSEQLVARGMYPITYFDHDAILLPDGYTVALGITERVFTDVQGVTGQVDILGDTIVALDQNLQLVWAWSIFDHYNINEPAVLGEVCVQGSTECPHLYTPINNQANDWTHSNSLDYNPLDGSLLLSVRHQDKVLKIAYGGGSGDGQVIWTLGNGGDFSIVSNDPNPWFSHQHDVNYESVNPEIIDLFDNGNTRIEENHGLGHSRGQVLQIDETSQTATLTLNADIGVYSPALGTAEKLLDGDYHFLAGVSSMIEPQDLIREFTLAQGSPYSLQSNSYSYRAFRMQSLYAQ